MSVRSGLTARLVFAIVIDLIDTKKNSIVVLGTGNEMFDLPKFGTKFFIRIVPPGLNISGKMALNKKLVWIEKLMELLVYGKV